MDDAIQLSPQLPNVQSGQNSGSQMFGIMDDIAQTFRSELSQAKSNLAKEEKSSSKPEKREASGDAKAKPEKMEQEGSAPKETEKEGVEAESTPEVAEELNEQPGAELVPVDVNTEEPELGVEVSSDPEGIAEVDEEDTEVLTASLEANEESTETQDTEAEATEVPLEQAARVESEDSAVPEETLSTEEEAAQESPSETVSNPTEAKTEVDSKELPAAPVAAAAAEKPATDQAEPATEAKALNPKEQAPLRASPNASPAPPSLPEAASEKAVEAQAAAKLDAAELPVEAEAEASKEFHSILSKEEADKEAQKAAQPQVIELNQSEANKIVQSLAEMANRTETKAPVAQKVSARILDGLKVHNAPMARQIESSQGQSSSSVGAGVAPIAKAPLPFSGVRNVDKPYENAKMEDLKQKVVQQVKFQVRLAMKDKVGQVKMQLNPHLLGKVRISLRIEDSQIAASFVVENQSVKELLQRSSSQLQDVLNEQGYDVNEVDVSVADDQSGGDKSGKGLASLEDQKAAREYIASLATLGGGDLATSGNLETSSEPDANGPSEPNQILNIVA